MFRREIFAILIAVIAGAPECAGGAIKPERARALEKLVLHDCGSCHGMTLKGGLGPNLEAKTLAGRSAQSIANIILDGVPGTPMPPWRPLMTESEARWIADYLLNEDGQ